MTNTNSLIEYDSRLFLFRALSELGESENVSIERIDELNRQIVVIMNKRSVMEPVDISKLSELRTVARDVVLRLNLGLEHETSFQKGNSYTAYLRLTKAAMTFQVLP